MAVSAAVSSDTRVTEEALRATWAECNAEEQSNLTDSTIPARSVHAERTDRHGALCKNAAYVRTLMSTPSGMWAYAGLAEEGQRGENQRGAQTP